MGLTGFEVFMVNNQKGNPMKSIKSQVFIGILEDYSDFCIFPFS